MRTIIIDDEPKSRNALKLLIAEYCPQVEIVGMAEDVLSGVKVIQQENPDLVFLDIEMPNYSGFQLVEYFEKINFQLVFTSAYEHYAVQAFKKSATGYLLKPIDIDELINVVKLVEQNIQNTISPNQVDSNTIQINPNKKIELPTKNGIIYLALNEILYLKADGRKTQIFFTNGHQEVSTLSMKKCDETFFKTTLLRIHKSHMINIIYLKKYIRKTDSFVEMEEIE